jgi:sugar phosphate isomerase/epimerase
MEVVHVGWVLGVTPEGNVRRLREAGVDAIELGLFESPVDAATPGPDLAFAPALAAECRAEGVRIHSVHAPFAGAWDLALEDEARRQRAIAAHRAVVSACAEIGVPLLIVHPGDACAADDDEASIRAVDSLGALAEFADDAGVVLAVENMPPGYVCPSAPATREAIDMISHPAVRACLDTGHAHMTGAHVSEGVRAFEGVLVTIHAHDNSGGADEHLLPGAGSIDWPAFGRELQATGYAGGVVLELRQPEGYTPRSMAEAFYGAIGRAAGGED